MLALAVLILTAGAAVASTRDATGPGDHGANGQARASQARARDVADTGGDAPAVTQVDPTQVDPTQVDPTQVAVVPAEVAPVDSLGTLVDVTIAGSSSSGGSGGVTGSGAGIPSVSVEAPAVAASGPAPDAAAAAPHLAPVTDTSRDAAAVGTTAPAADTAPVAPTDQLDGVDASTKLDSTGSIGAVANQLTDTPSAARALVRTDTGRSVALIGALLVGIALFLGVHRRVDWGDRKLAAARSGPEVARFR